MAQSSTSGPDDPLVVSWLESPGLAIAVPQIRSVSPRAHPDEAAHVRLAEQVIPGISQTTRQCVASPDSLLRAGAGGAVLWSWTPQLDIRTLSRLAGLDPDEDDINTLHDLKTKTTPEVGVGQDSGTTSNRHATEDDGEEHREIKVRLQELRLDLLQELQSAGSLPGGDVTPFDWSRPASRSGYTESKHTDALNPPSPRAPRHLKPLMTIAIAKSRLQNLERAKMRGSSASPLLRGSASITAQRNVGGQHDPCLGQDPQGDAQQQYQDRVHDMFSMEPESMKLRSRPSMPEQRPHSASPNITRREGTPKETVAERQVGNTEALATSTHSRRSLISSEVAQKTSSAKDSESLVSQILDVIVEDALEWVNVPATPPPASREAVDIASEAVNDILRLAEDEIRGKKKAIDGLKKPSTPELQLCETIDGGEDTVATPVETADEAQGAATPFVEPTTPSRPDQTPSAAWPDVTSSAGVTLPIVQGHDVHQVEPHETDKADVEAERAAESSSREQRLCWKCFAIVSDAWPECRACRADLLISKCSNCACPVSAHVGVCAMCMRLSGTAKKTRNKSPPVLVSKWGTCLSSHDVKADMKRRQLHLQVDDSPTPLSWTVQNAWGGYEEDVRLAGRIQVAVTISPSALQARQQDDLRGTCPALIVDEASGECWPSSGGRLPKTRGTAKQEALQGDGRAGQREGLGGGKLLSTTRRVAWRKAGSSARSAAGADEVDAAARYQRSGDVRKKTALMVLTPFVSGIPDSRTQRSMHHYAADSTHSDLAYSSGCSTFFGHRIPSDPIARVAARRGLYAREHTSVYGSGGVYSTNGETPVAIHAAGALPVHAAMSVATSSVDRSRSSNGLKGSFKTGRSRSVSEQRAGRDKPQQNTFSHELQLHPHFDKHVDGMDLSRRADDSNLGQANSDSYSRIISCGNDAEDPCTQEPCAAPDASNFRVMQRPDHARASDTWPPPVAICDSFASTQAFGSPVFFLASQVDMREIDGEGDADDTGAEVSNSQRQREEIDQGRKSRQVHARSRTIAARTLVSTTAVDAASGKSGFNRIGEQESQPPAACLSLPLMQLQLPQNHAAEGENLMRLVQHEGPPASPRARASCRQEAEPLGDAAHMPRGWVGSARQPSNAATDEHVSGTERYLHAYDSTLSLVAKETAQDHTERLTSAEQARSHSARNYAPRSQSARNYASDVIGQSSLSIRHNTIANANARGVGGVAAGGGTPSLAVAFDAAQRYRACVDTQRAKTARETTRDDETRQEFCCGQRSLTARHARPGLVAEGLIRREAHGQRMQRRQPHEPASRRIRHMNLTPGQLHTGLASHRHAQVVRNAEQMQATSYTVHRPKTHKLTSGAPVHAVPGCSASVYFGLSSDWPRKPRAPPKPLRAALAPTAALPCSGQNFEQQVDILGQDARQCSRGIGRAGEASPHSTAASFQQSEMQQMEATEQGRCSKLFDDFAQLQEKTATGNYCDQRRNLMDASAFIDSLVVSNIVWEDPLGAAIAKTVARQRGVCTREAALQIFKACSFAANISPTNDSRQSDSRMHMVLDLHGFLRACAAMHARLDKCVGTSYEAALACRSRGRAPRTAPVVIAQQNIAELDLLPEAAKTSQAAAAHASRKSVKLKSKDRKAPLSDDMLQHLLSNDAGFWKTGWTAGNSSARP